MNRLFLILFFISCLVHLVFSWMDRRKARACTKPFPLLFLMLYYITGAGEIETLLILALFCSWMGDILLIPTGKGWFVSGGTSFILAHLFFILVYAGHIRWEIIPWFVVIPVVTAAFGVVLSCLAALFAGGVSITEGILPGIILGYILYRQLDRLEEYSLDALLDYARRCTEFIFLQTALDGQGPAHLRRWSEPIEYSTENVEILLGT